MRRYCKKCALGDIIVGGNGKCSTCWGSGISSSKQLVNGFSYEIMGKDVPKDKIACDTCSATGQCQRCGGEGWIYVDDYNDTDEDDNEDDNTEDEGDDNNYVYTKRIKSQKEKDSDRRFNIGCLTIFLLPILIFGMFKLEFELNREQIQLVAYVTSQKPIIVYESYDCEIQVGELYRRDKIEVHEEFTSRNIYHIYFKRFDRWKRGFIKSSENITFNINHPMVQEIKTKSY